MKVKQMLTDHQDAQIMNPEHASEDETKEQTTAPEREYNERKSWLDEHKVVKAHVVGD